MTIPFPEIAPFFLMLALAITLLAGFVKGAVGFAMPTVMISGMASFLSPELALAAVILPAVVANFWQALRNGFGAALASARRFWLFILLVLIFILGSAQLFRFLPSRAMFLILGIPITTFAVLQLMGWRLKVAPENRRRVEVTFGAIAGFIGGVSGAWGPPTVAYLTAIELPKSEHVRVQGVVYSMGGVMLLAAHTQSGVLNANTLPFSLIMIVPAMFGMWLGYSVHKRLDQERFRRATLFVLVVAGLNLIRRGLLG